MIVVNHARPQLGTTATVVVSSALQTGAGRLIFAELKGMRAARGGSRSALMRRHAALFFNLSEGAAEAAQVSAAARRRGGREEPRPAADLGREVRIADWWRSDWLVHEAESSASISCRAATGVICAPWWMSARTSANGRRCCWIWSRRRS
jgi:hypothetical protein